jgi:phosphatidylserine/phosphatidylglycerophosphate/cardiolipin synthase-like enzyme
LSRVYKLLVIAAGIAALLSFCACSPGRSSGSASAVDQKDIEVFFSPGGGCAAAVVSEINGAGEEILVQAYSFTSAPIAAALVDAHKRGVAVRIILDKSQRSARYSSADFTAHSGIPTFIDSAHAIAHNKVMIIDRRVVITGSFNFTKAAEEKNAENLLVIRSAGLAEKYLANWNRHRAHSEEYGGRR